MNRFAHYTHAETNHEGEGDKLLTHAILCFCTIGKLTSSEIEIYVNVTFCEHVCRTK